MELPRLFIEQYYYPSLGRWIFSSDYWDYKQLNLTLPFSLGLINFYSLTNILEMIKFQFGT